MVIGLAPKLLLTLDALILYVIAYNIQNIQSEIHLIFTIYFLRPAKYLNSNTGMKFVGCWCYIINDDVHNKSLKMHLKFNFLIYKRFFCLSIWEQFLQSKIKDNLGISKCLQKTIAIFLFQ